MATIICDECASEFVLSADDIKQITKMVGGIEVSYFCCPKCNAPYVIQVLDENTKRMQIEYQEFSERFEKLKATSKNEKQLQSVYTVLIAKKKKLASRIYTLKEQFGDELKQYLN